jgi:hypothetical protein
MTKRSQGGGRWWGGPYGCSMRCNKTNTGPGAEAVVLVQELAKPQNTNGEQVRMGIWRGDILKGLVSTKAAPVWYESARR